MAYKQNPGRGPMQKTGHGIPKGMTSPMHQESNKENPWEVTSRETTTRAGAKDGIEGTFTDVTTGERRSTVKSGGKEMPNSDWKKFVKNNPDWKKNRVEDRSNVDTSFSPNPPPPPSSAKPAYSGYDVSQATAQSFGAHSTRNYTSSSADADAVIQRSKKTQKLGKINGGSEQAIVIGIKDKKNYEKGKNKGKGFLMDEMKTSKVNNRSSFKKGEITRDQFNAKTVAIASKHKSDLNSLKKGTYKMSEKNQGLFNKSHETIYNRSQEGTVRVNDPIKISKKNKSVTKKDFKGRLNE